MVKTFKINNKEIKYKLVYRDVKYPRLEYRTGKLVLILPEGSNNEEDILRHHKRWIYEKYKKITKALENSDSIKLNKNMDKKKLKKLVYVNVNKFSEKFKTQINKIFIKKMKTKWASLSSRQNITLNSYCMFLPQELIEYIIFHEVTHLKVRKHNDKFWKLIEKKYSDYKKYEDELFKYWFLLQKEILS